MEYALGWRQSPVVLFPLREKKKKTKRTKTPKPLLSGIYSPPFTPTYNTAVPLAQISEHGPAPPPKAFAALPSPPNSFTFAPFQLFAPPTPYLKSILTTTPKELEQCSQDTENLPFPQTPRKRPYSVFPLREVILGWGEIGFINACLNQL
jgi:hypothetical protein